MRDLTDTLTRGPFRDGTHRAAVEATAVDLASGPLRESQAAVSSGPATSVWSGGRNAVSERPRVTIGGPVPNQVAWMIAKHHVANAYDAATRALASTGPLPLASNEPWVENDEAYRERLGFHRFSEDLTSHIGYYEPGLNEIGRTVGLPRARLVPATTMQGEQHD